jgi:tetratricopeptide (TPR) repeat protein
MGAFYFRKSEPNTEMPSRTPTPKASQPPLDSRLYAVYSEGLELLGREEFAQAGERFKQLLKSAPDCPLGKTGMAILLSNQGREIEARDMLAEVADHSQPIAETHFMLGLLDERAGLYANALASYEKALAADDTFFMALFNRAWVLKRMGRTDEFAAEMKGALAILKSSAKCPAWATGGLGLEAILGLVAEAIEQDSEDNWK